MEFESFVALINSVLLFDVQRDEADLAAKALQRANLLVHSADTEENMHGLISGLATVASVTRSTELANVLRVFVRVVRRRKRVNLDPADELRVAMAAAASFADVPSWARFAGEWIREIAFEIAKSTSAETVRESLRNMVRLAPDLASHVAPADAALALVAQRIVR